MAINPALTSEQSPALGPSETIILPMVDRQNPGVAIVLPVAAEDAIQLAVPQGLAPGDLHLTLASLGNATDQPPGAFWEVAAALKGALPTLQAVQGTLQGPGRFAQEGKPDCLYASVDAPALQVLRDQVMAALLAAGVAPATDHGFTPHITLAYAEPGTERGDIRPSGPITFSSVALWWAGERVTFPLRGVSVPVMARSKSKRVVVDIAMDLVIS